MIKICSLEFLNRDVFDAEVLSKNGAVMVDIGEKVTPEILLRLYFKDIYVAQELPSLEEIEEEVEEVKLEDLISVKPDINESLPLDLKFDEEQAKRVSNLSSLIGKMVGLKGDKISELEDAAYYHKVGISKLTQKDFADKDFRTKQGKEGYNILLEEMKLSKEIAEVAKSYFRKYESSQFSINEGPPSNIPYSHIVSIASYYDELLSKNYSKEKALKKMLQLGGNKFNIFILHKFIKMMREAND